MHEPDDHTLLRQFAEQNSEAAFAAIVARHVDKVYSTALRHTRSAHAAEEITQAVFVILAKESGRLGAKVILAGWLYETARLTAMTFIRSEIRRARREQEAHMQTALNENDEAWPHIAPLLDDAMAGLSAADRHAIVLRYFDGKSLGEVGVAMGASEDAAKKRVTRAVEKLRGWFTKRGVTQTATVLTAAISANSVRAAPLGLAKIISVIAITKGATAGGSTLALVKGALKVMAWTKMKMAIVVGVGVLLAAGTATVVFEKHIAAEQFVTAREPWLDVGAATPKAALQSLACAITQGKTERAQELIQWDEKGLAFGGDTTVKREITLMSALPTALEAIKSFRILSITPTKQPNEVIVKIEKTFRNKNIKPFSVTAKLRRVGGQWRAVCDIEYFEAGGISTLLPFSGSF